MNKIEYAILIAERSTALVNYIKDFHLAFALENKRQYERVELALKVMFDKCGVTFPVTATEIKCDIDISIREKGTLLINRAKELKNALEHAHDTNCEKHLLAVHDLLHDIGCEMNVVMSEKDQRLEATDGRR